MKKRCRDADTAVDERETNSCRGDKEEDADDSTQQQQKKRTAAAAKSICCCDGAAAEEKEKKRENVATLKEDVAARRAAVEQCRADIDRLQRELAEKKAALEENERALETAAKALMAAEAQSPAAAEASGHFAMLSDFEILEILRCLVPAMPPRWESDEAAASLKEKFSWLCAVSATCRRLHALASSPELWRSFEVFDVVFSASEERRDEIIGRLCSAPWLLAQSERFSITAQRAPELALVEKMPNLRMLGVSFRGEKCSDKKLKRLETALSSLKHLRKLKLQGSDSDVLHEFRLEDSPVQSLVLFNCPNIASFSRRVFPRITELGLILPHRTADEDAATITRALPNLRKLSTDMDLGAFWKHCHHLEVVIVASESSHSRIDVLAASPCSQTLCRFCGGWQVDCTELARAAPNLITVDLMSPTNIAGLAGLAHLQELVIHDGTFEDLNELGERAHGMRLKKLALSILFGRPVILADLTRLFGSPCCSQLEVLVVDGFMIDSCIAGLASRSGPLPLRSFFSRGFPSKLSALLAKCPALTEIEVEDFTPGEIAQSLGTTPSIAPVREFSASLRSAEDLLAVGNVFGRTLQVVKFIDLDDQAAIDAFVASCPRLSSIRFNSRIKQLPCLPPWTIAEKIDED